MNVESIEIHGWNEVQTGLIISETDQWLLVKHIPVDYMIDGFRIYNKKFVNRRSNGTKEKLIERVLSLKSETTEKPISLDFTEVSGLLQWSERTFGIFEFQDDDETELFYGRMNKITADNFLVIDSIFADGSVEYNYDFEFSINEIRVVGFESDYFNSIRLLWMDENQILIKPTP
jgi:hypothetical protein